MAKILRMIEWDTNNGEPLQFNVAAALFFQLTAAADFMEVAVQVQF